LFSISLLLIACGASHQKSKEPDVPVEQVAPSPITTPGTDSLKNSLDQEREKRKKK
jgi:hypothetical protein